MSGLALPSGGNIKKAPSSSSAPAPASASGSGSSTLVKADTSSGAGAGAVVKAGQPTSVPEITAVQGLVPTLQYVLLPLHFEDYLAVIAFYKHVGRC
jgi:transcription initiation factor TFIID TATA-box-binding protein